MIDLNRPLHLLYVYVCMYVYSVYCVDVDVNLNYVTECYNQVRWKIFVSVAECEIVDSSIWVDSMFTVHTGERTKDPGLGKVL